MPIFELDDGRPRLVQPMQPLPGSFAQDCAALLTDHLAAVAGEPLFVVRARAATHEHADVPELLALDSTGRPVVVEVVQVVDDDAVVAALRHAGSAARMTTTDLSRAYHPDPSRFAVDFAAFREQVAFGATTSRREGVRLVLLCSEVASEAGDTLGFLRGPGRHVDVLQVGVVRGVDDRRLLDVSALATHETVRRPVEPTALRLVRSSEAFASAMAYDTGRATIGARGASAPSDPPAPAPREPVEAPPAARTPDPVLPPPSPAPREHVPTPPAPDPVPQPAPAEAPARYATAFTPQAVTPAAGARFEPGDALPPAFTPAGGPTPSLPIERATFEPQSPATSYPQTPPARGATGPVRVSVLGSGSSATHAGFAAPTPPPGVTPQSAPVTPAVPANPASPLNPSTLPSHSAPLTSPPPLRPAALMTPPAPAPTSAPGPLGPAAPLRPATVPSSPAAPPAGAAHQTPPPADLPGVDEGSVPLPELAMLAKRRRALTTLVWFRERRNQRFVALLRHDGLLQLPDGRLFVDPDDAAGAAASALARVDGWRSWRLGDGGPTLAEAAGLPER